ncbi:MAG TPA: nucleoside triphosphate pyrophosphohydrolase [Steroidobacteraceae bacterium]|jgi:ATP diphosphatase
MTGQPAATDRIRELLGIMERLRAADGCPWDRAQSFASIAPYTIEEAYEVADAVERGDMPHLRDELGDLLFQVVFHAQIASEAQQFDFEAVAGAICDKLLRRHPHVFGASGPLTQTEQNIAWEEIKAAERGAAGADRSHLDGVPRALPALMRAYKLSKRAARVGFDFEHASQTADKVAEELAEVRDAAAAQSALADAANHGQESTGASPEITGASPEIFEEIGDLLFAAANLARKLDVDAEAALRSANAKFERRFRGMESLAAQRGAIFAELDLESQERLWQEVKRGE